jgi:hypothetical protein
MVRLRYQIGKVSKGTGYGMRWPPEPRGEAYYIQLAEDAGFQLLTTERFDHVLYFVLAKKGNNHV